MSILPLLFDIADELTDSPFDRYNSFGRSIHPNELTLLSEPRVLHSLIPRSSHHTGYHRRPRCLGKLKTCNGKSTIGKDGFQVCMDVQDFAPNEISVKTVDNSIVVEGKHEERQDESGFISRQFTRRYTLPKGYDAKDVVSQLSSDGVLTVKAPPPVKSIEGDNVRVIQVQQTGPAHLTVGNKEDNKNGAPPEKMTE